MSTAAEIDPFSTGVATSLRTHPSTPVTVRLGQISRDEARGLAVGDRVRIDALMKVETTPGGAIKTTYTAKAVRSLNNE